MYHFFEAISTAKGDSLVGYQVSLRDPVTNAVIPIFSDINGTPIISLSGIPNVAVTDANGNANFFVADGTYGLVVADSMGNQALPTIANIPMYGVLSLDLIFQALSGLPDTSLGAPIPTSGFYWNGELLARVQPSS